MKNPSAYIYSRVSKETQAINGEGLQRQEDRAKTFIDNLNHQRIKDNLPAYTIADSIITDIGLSGYYGLNTQENAGLGAFIKAAETANIEPGSLLVVEAVDRISRLPADDARDIFRKLAKLKIDIAITKFSLIITHDQKTELGTDLLLTAAFHLANLESEQKSQRIRATIAIRRKEDREGGKKRTSNCPAWMELSDDRMCFELIPEKAAVIKRIFDMKIAGKGSHLICKQLNEEGIPRPAQNDGVNKTWNKAMVEKYLKMIQTYGAFQPTETQFIDGKKVTIPLGDVIENYYPAVVDKETFIQTQQSFKKGLGTRGRKAKGSKNLFANLACCPACGSSAPYFNPAVRGRAKLRCRNHMDHQGCDVTSIDYEECEDLLIKCLSGLDYSKLRGESFELLEREIANLEYQIDIEKEAVAEIQNKLAVAPVASISTLVDVINKRQTTIEELSKQHADKVRVQLDYSAKSIDTLNISNEEDRIKYNRFLMQYIDYILVGDKSIGKVEIKFKQIPKLLTFYFNDKSDTSESIVKDIFTNNKSVKEVKLPWRMGENIYDSRLYEIDTVPLPRNQNDKRDCLIWYTAVMHEINTNPKWTDTVERWKEEDSWEARRVEV